MKSTQKPLHEKKLLVEIIYGVIQSDSLSIKANSLSNSSTSGLTDKRLQGDLKKVGNGPFGCLYLLTHNHKPLKYIFLHKGKQTDYNLRHIRQENCDTMLELCEQFCRLASGTLIYRRSEILLKTYERMRRKETGHCCVHPSRKQAACEALFFFIYIFLQMKTTEHGQDL